MEATRGFRVYGLGNGTEHGSCNFSADVAGLLAFGVHSPFPANP